MTAIRLLYVEDNPQDADQTRQYFAHHAPDFEMEIVESGELFLARLKQQTFDVLLIDNRLPDIEGVQLLHTLERSGAHPPVILLSGARDAKVVVQALSLGAADYVPKRVNYLAELPELLRAAVYTSRARALHISARVPAASHILYIEHDPADVGRTLIHLDHAFIIQIADTARQACELLTKPHTFDLILCGENAEGLSALDLLYELKQAQPLPPFIVLTRAGHEYEAIAAIKLGAHDYLVEREGYLNHLPIAIKNAIAQERLRKEHARMAKELAESALRESDTRWQFAVEGAGDGLWDWDIPTKTIYYSKQLRTILGLDVNEEVSDWDKWSGRIHTDDRADVLLDLESQLNGQSTANAREYRVQRKDGTYIWVLGRMLVMRRDAAGKPLRVVGTQSDITERKLIERKVELAASVFSHAHEGIIITDAAGTIMEANEAFSRLCGYSPAETVGQNLRLFKSNRQSDEFYALMWRSLLDEGHWHGELWNRRKNGDEYAVMLTISAVRDPAGTTQNYVALFTNKV
jgi:PAS domain S-box-containing protein